MRHMLTSALTLTQIFEYTCLKEIESACEFTIQNKLIQLAYVNYIAYKY